MVNRDSVESLDPLHPRDPTYLSVGPLFSVDRDYLFGAIPVRHTTQTVTRPVRVSWMSTPSTPSRLDDPGPFRPGLSRRPVPFRLRFLLTPLKREIVSDRVPSRRLRVLRPRPLFNEGVPEDTLDRTSRTDRDESR